MPASIPSDYLDLFSKKAFGVLATLMPNGHPQATPVWCDLVDGHVLVNSAKGRQKDRNIRRDPRVTITVVDPDKWYRYLEVRGRVVEVTENGADAHINKLAKKYLGVDVYPFRQPGEVRVVYRIEPQHVGGYSG